MPAENQGKREKQICNVSGVFGSLHTSNDQVTEGRCEHEEAPDVQEHQCSTLIYGIRWLGVLREADRVVPADKDDHAHERVPR